MDTIQDGLGRMGGLSLCQVEHHKIMAKKLKQVFQAYVQEWSNGRRKAWAGFGGPWEHGGRIHQAKFLSYNLWILKQTLLQVMAECRTVPS